MTPEQLKAIRERAEKAHEAFLKIHRVATRQSDESYMRIPADPRRDADLILGAFFREDIPALLAHVDALEAALEAVRGMLVAENQAHKETRAALATAQERAERAERVLDAIAQDYPQMRHSYDGFVFEGGALWSMDEMKHERDEANARAKEAEDALAYQRSAIDAYAKSENEAVARAQSARREALEEAAKIAEDFTDGWETESGKSPRCVEYRDAPEIIARDIRALLTPKEAPEEGTK